MYIMNIYKRGSYLKSGANVGLLKKLITECPFRFTLIFFLFCYLTYDASKLFPLLHRLSNFMMGFLLLS